MLTNADVSLGNSWVRGFVGWKNDLFVFQKVLWAFQPMIGCKAALPEGRWTNGSIRMGIAFPAIISNEQVREIGRKNFWPVVFLDFDVYCLFVEIALSNKLTYKK
jgi:hypothetical protein